MKSTRIRLGLTCTVMACVIIAVLCSTEARAGRPVPWTANYEVDVYVDLLGNAPSEAPAGHGYVRADQNFHVIASDYTDGFKVSLWFYNPEYPANEDHIGQLAIQPSKNGSTAFFSYFFPEYIPDFHAFQLISQAGRFEGDWKAGWFKFSSEEVILYTTYNAVAPGVVYSVRVEGRKLP